MSKLTKKDFVKHLMDAGYTEQESHKIVNDLSDFIVEGLCKGSTVYLPKIGKITPTIRQESEMLVNNTVTVVPEHIRLSFSISRTMKQIFKGKYSTKAKSTSSLRQLGKNLFK